MEATRQAGAREARAWLAFGAVAVLIFLTVPIARSLQRAVEETVGRELFLGVVLFGIAAAAAGAWRRLPRQGGFPQRRALALAGVVAAYAAGAIALRRNPEEAIHLLEYGALGVLGARALAFRIPGRWVYPSAALLGASVGMLDEGLQWLTPDRHWDLRDLAINALAASGVQLAFLAGAFGPTAQGGGAQGRRGFCIVASAAWLLLGASLLNTPPRIAAYASAVPGLGFLLENDGVMLEYGTLHELPGVARYRSRFTRQELARLDAARSDEAGGILRREGADEDYGAFLATYNPVRDPFLHELRVHLFRRDRYLETASWHDDDPDWARRDLTVAFRENAILEAAFPASLAAAGRSWPAAERDRIGQQQRADRPYESPVSRGLVTALTERTIALVWLGGFVLLGLGLRPIREPGSEIG